MSKGISNPTIKHGGEVIFVISNSVEYEPGLGTKVIRTISGGGNNIRTVATENVEDKKSMMKFSLPNNGESIALISTFSNLSDLNRLEISSDDLKVSFRGMTLINNPMRPLTQDGVIECEFEGPPSIESA